MYKYDIQYPNKEQFTLLYGVDGKSWIPINLSKNVSYLKTKMKAHRDEMVDAGYDDIGYYCIENPEKKIVFSQTFLKGVKGEGNLSYHVESPKPKFNYRKAYLYNRTDNIVLEKKGGIFPVVDYDVICNDAGDVVTDLKLLKMLGDFIFYERIPAIVTKKAQVSMATFIPQTKDEFVKLPGCGEKLFSKCGEKIINFINAYLDSAG